MRTFPGCALVILALVALGLAACEPALPDQPAPDPAACSDASQGDAAGFEAAAGPIFETYCVWCHDSAKTGATDRKGAPEGVDYDGHDFPYNNTYLTWARVADRTMPPLGRLPSAEEYQILLDWLSCADALREQQRGGGGDDDDSAS